MISKSHFSGNGVREQLSLFAMKMSSAEKNRCKETSSQPPGVTGKRTREKNPSPKDVDSIVKLNPIGKQ